MVSPVIRDAERADIPRIIEMGRKFLLEGPYKDIIEDHPEVPTALAYRLLEMPNAKVLVLVDTGRVEGFIGIVVLPHFYSGRTTAHEMIWYVTPEIRKTFGAICLLRAAQRSAKEMGAEYMQCTAPLPEIGRMYEMCGYSQVEVAYQKRLI